jgi:hypothetical protein
MGARVIAIVAKRPLPEPDRQEFQPPRLRREDLLSDVMRDLVARQALSGVAPSEAELQSSLERTMRRAGKDVWVFAYGSLIWNPIFPVAERRVARAFGLEARVNARARHRRNVGGGRLSASS